MGEDGGCFEDRLESSELGRDHCLLNYAVNAYGLDQSVLLFERSVDRYAALDPVVVLALVPEADLDRCTFSFFTRPKPRLRRAGDGFVLERPDDVPTYLAEHPPSIRSYAWRYLLNGLGVPVEMRQRWEGEPARRAERDRIVDHLLEEFERACGVRHLEHFALVLHMRAALSCAAGTEETELHARLARLGIPFVDARTCVERALAERRCSLADLFGPTEHPNAAGITVLFEALALGLRCEFDVDTQR